MNYVRMKSGQPVNKKLCKPLKVSFTFFFQVYIMIFIQFHEQTLHNISTTECEYLVRVDLFLDGVDETACRLVRLVLIRNLLDAVDDGRVISAAEQRTDGI